MTHVVTIHSRSAEETAALGRFVGERAVEGLFLALAGDLGTGKTCFVQGLAAGLGIRGTITSPTFTIMNYYEGHPALKHFDFYRLRRAEELYDIGWDEYGAGGVVVAEWADLFPEVVPPEAVWLTFSVISETERRVVVGWTEKAPAGFTREVENYAAGH